MPLLKEITNAEIAQGLFNGRREAGAIANTEFYNGNHFQDGKGWIGAKPLVGVTGFTSTMTQIKEAFVSENVIAEVNDRHLAGLLGREPLWGFVPKETVNQSTLRRRTRFAKIFSLLTNQSQSQAQIDKFAQEADDALTEWWDQRKPRKQLKDAVTMVLNEERALLRFFIPKGLRNDNGEIEKQPSLVDALKFLHIDVISADKGGVFIDDDTQKEFGLYVYQLDGKAVGELTYVNDLGSTLLQLLNEDSIENPLAYELQGRLWMHELERDPLITEQIRSNQRSLNLALTMMMRNVNLAGSLERTVMNAERPSTTIRITDATQSSGYREERRDAEYFDGPGATMFLTGLLIRDDNGTVVGRANPNINFREPVQIGTFTGTRDQYYASILGQTQQRHALISGDATASGRSREQARAEFESSLKLTKEVVDDAGRWLLEVALRLAAQLCGRSKDFANLRCEFNSLIETGPQSSEERSANREDVKAGLLSKETAMGRNSVDDTDAEKSRIAEDKANSPAPVIDLTTKPENGGQELPAQ